MTRNQNNYGDSKFRQFPTFGESGIKVQHSTEPARNASPKGCHTNPSMKPIQNMVHQPTHKRAPVTMVGNRPTRSQPAPSTGMADGSYQDVMDYLNADENEPITGEERHIAEVYARDEWGDSDTNVF